MSNTRLFCEGCGARLPANFAQPHSDAVCPKCNTAVPAYEKSAPANVIQMSDEESFFSGFDHAQESKRNEYERQTRGGIAIVPKLEYRAG